MGNESVSSVLAPVAVGHRFRGRVVDGIFDGVKGQMSFFLQVDEKIHTKTKYS